MKGFTGKLFQGLFICIEQLDARHVAGASLRPLQNPSSGWFEVMRNTLDHAWCIARRMQDDVVRQSMLWRATCSR